MLTGKKIAIAPVFITPTKPLTPSHFKALLWLDVLYKCMKAVHTVTLLQHQAEFIGNQQTARFWAWLDSVHTGADYTTKDELWIGQQYVAAHQPGETEKIDRQLYFRYKQQAENSGWMHPSADRLLQIWKSHCAQMHISPSLFQFSIHRLHSLEAVLQMLAEKQLLLDLRSVGGEVFLDPTLFRQPLRKLADAEGDFNYLMPTLQSVLPVAHAYERVLLLCDRELDHDYHTLETVINHLGFRAKRISLGRVPLGGKISSGRAGGWESFLFKNYPGAGSGQISFSLGLRLYFIVHLGSGSGRDFSFAEMQHWIDIATTVLEKLPPAAEETAWKNFLGSLVNREDYYISPHRLVSQLLLKKPSPFAGNIIKCLLAA